MRKEYRVYTEHIQRGVYTVQAESAEEASIKYIDDFEHYEELTGNEKNGLGDWDMQEEVIKIETNK